ncbi:P-loop containing nucleoside triphosphate hydrolase [Phytophthora cactorum]|nr:P-loop containing nucleoside triphosphate hydrolase [Phytophthora cactorum]
MEKMDGKVSVNGKVAYYAQQPWIQNMTIRENITFGHDFDTTSTRMSWSLWTSPDLQQFPGGDTTEIGQKGINLSGGQKARVSLARACYSDADIFILDSPLAAVDAVVQSKIFSKCICGLLAGKTVVLVTHNQDVIESGAASCKVSVSEGQVSVERQEIEHFRTHFATQLSPNNTKNEPTATENDDILKDTTRLIEDEEREEGRVRRRWFGNISTQWED